MTEPLLGLALLGAAEEVISRNQWPAGSHFRGAERERERRMCAAGEGGGRAGGSASMRAGELYEAPNLAESANTLQGHRAQTTHGADGTHPSSSTLTGSLRPPRSMETPSPKRWNWPQSHVTWHSS